MPDATLLSDHRQTLRELNGPVHGRAKSPPPALRTEPSPHSAVWPDMTALLYVGITLATVAGMEFVAWAAHKYLMHGWLWTWHEDHHRPHHEEDGFFEKNDLFFLVFAIPSAASYIVGLNVDSVFWLTFVGIGISIYGLIYFLIHDVYIHRRFSWFKHLDSKYSRAILRAHGHHHAVTEKDGCESFGLLVVDDKYFGKRKEWQQDVVVDRESE